MTELDLHGKLNTFSNVSSNAQYQGSVHDDGSLAQMRNNHDKINVESKNTDSSKKMKKLVTRSANQDATSRPKRAIIFR